ncbi:MAG TPA: trehalose-phosphatase [Parvibaculum sp.]
MTKAETSLPPPIRSDAALFLDFDGTLVEISGSPNDVTVAPDLPPLLECLSRRLNGALAIVSGRSVDDVGALLSPFGGPIVGLHGLEYRTDAGEIYRREPMPELAEARAAVVAALAGKAGVTIEDKGLTAAIHYRQAPLEAATCVAVAERAVEAARGVLMLRHGKMLVEIGPRDMNKGAGIEMLMGAPLFRGRVPVFLGDDVTDEDGFAVVNALGGISIRVGDDRETDARYRVPDVPSVIAYLKAFASGAGANENLRRGVSA